MERFELSDTFVSAVFEAAALDRAMLHLLIGGLKPPPIYITTFFISNQYVIGKTYIILERKLYV